ncbi:hypothetical protein ACIQGZ_02035 [Streptomyces sp. NPDC092296]|uniref:hypothetical protein n=1 Tax=Streptomyces sp. NPDC092296 TaxID=3366012 RepID=UPI00381E6719
MRRTTALSAALSAALAATLLAGPALAYADTGTAAPEATATATAPAPADDDAPADPGQPDPGTPDPGQTDPGQTDPGQTDPAPQVSPTIDSIGTVAGDSGILQVSASSDTAIAQVTATVSRSGIEVGRFPLTPVAGADHLWQSTRMVLLLDMTYDVTVTAVDEDGDSTDVTKPQAISYYMQPHVLAHQLTVPQPLDYQHRTVTASGRIEALNPSTGVTGPLVGRHIDLRVGSAVWDDATDSTGSYHFSVPADAVAAAGASKKAEILYLGGGPQLVFDSTSLSTLVSQTRIRLDHSSLTIKYGTKVAISGTAEYNYGGVWKPLPSARVSLKGTVATANSAGRFTVKYATAPSDDGSWTVSLSPQTPGNSFLKTSKATFKVDVINKITLSLTTTGLDEFADLHLRGTMASSNKKLPGTRKIYVQKSANGKSGWKSAGWFTTAKNGSFDVYGYQATPRGYWRLYYPAAKDYQAAYSRTIHHARTDTRITGFSVSPKSIRKGRTITVKGTLQKQPASKWGNFTKQRIYYLFQAKGSKKVTLMGTSKTDSHGRFSKHFTAKKTGTWSVVWITPNNKYVDAFSKEVKVSVR